MESKEILRVLGSFAEFSIFQELAEFYKGLHSLEKTKIKKSPGDIHIVECLQDFYKAIYKAIYKSIYKAIRKTQKCTSYCTSRRYREIPET